MHDFAPLLGLLLSGVVIGLGIGTTLRPLVELAGRIQRQRRDDEVRPRP